MDNIKRISFIIINWNRTEVVLRGIGRMSKLMGPEDEIVVVDNGSTDGPLERLGAVDAVRVIALGENLGPAHARNVALDAARGRYIFFLDSDSLPGRRVLDALLRRMDDDPEVGIIGCRIVNVGTRKLDQWIYAQSPATHEHLMFETYSFSAAGALARADALRAAGGFWDDLFIYNEEVDLSIRVIRSGYSILYCPDAPVFHLALDQGRVRPGAYWYYQIRNWIWIFYRYYPPLVCFPKVALYAAIYLLKAARARHLREGLAGIVAGLRRIDIIRRYDDKMSARELRRLRSLNRRTAIRGVIRTGLSHELVRLFEEHDSHPRTPYSTSSSRG
jgi:GT2 family glycosyltransferase